MVLAVVAALGAGGRPAGTGADPSLAPAPAASASGPAQLAADPELEAAMDAVVAFAPPDTCLGVEVDGQPVYSHRADQPLVPASTLKLVTAAVALDLLGADHRYRTRVVGTTAPQDGVLGGDLVLVGGGDPLLATNAYRYVAGIGPDQPMTSLDQLADEVAASGVKWVTGRVLGDETRYDTERSVRSWPQRFVDQGQSGPLSALTVDGGNVLRLPEEGERAEVDRARSDDPAGDAARVFTDLLRARGIRVEGEGATGAAPPDAPEVAAVESAPFTEPVRRLLEASDNQTAELIAKELGVRFGDGGTTAAGTAVVERRAAELGLGAQGFDAVDGSGLDPGNRVTCDQLLEVLDRSGGIDGDIGPYLAVWGETGTLAGRDPAIPVAGRMRAKTGTLADVSSLAGYVPVDDETVVTFAFVANGVEDRQAVLRVQDLLAHALGDHRPVCAEASTPMVAPASPYAGGVGTLAMFPLQTVLLPGAVLPLHVFEERYRILVDRCLAEDRGFGVVLIARGSEVGGGDQRTDVGTRAEIVQAERSPDGRWGLLTVGRDRFRVTRWLPDDPHPLAKTDPWPDPGPGPGAAAAVAGAAVGLRRLLALAAELGEAVPPATAVEVGQDPVADSYRLAALAPAGPLDRQRLLEAEGAEERAALLEALVADHEAVVRARLAGA